MDGPFDRLKRAASRLLAGGRTSGLQGSYLCLLGALLAKTAKADGFVDSREIASIESAFTRLGFSTSQRHLCVAAFQDALGRPMRADFYANEMMRAGFGAEMRMLAYELIWDVACADGTVAPAERDVLSFLERALYLPPGSFARCFQRRTRHDTPAPARDPLEEAYEELGCKPAASDDELRTAYHDLAKKLHPDVLRAQGLPEAMLKHATDRMARINAAWERIRASRGK